MRTLSTEGGVRKSLKVLKVEVKFIIFSVFWPYLLKLGLTLIAREASEVINGKNERFKHKKGRRPLGATPGSGSDYLFSKTDCIRNP